MLSYYLLVRRALRVEMSSNTHTHVHICLFHIVTQGTQGRVSAPRGAAAELYEWTLHRYIIV